MNAGNLPACFVDVSATKRAGVSQPINVDGRSVACLQVRS